ncbi:hypothetical protein IGK74_000409 [Enterococcus sp. AZ150]|uniref:DUF6731 family protein n=1 Tax=Enterococcus sp. AZ150 TaxID=2774866 RepID=UPI003F27C911
MVKNKTRYIRFDFFEPKITRFEMIKDPENNRKKIKKIISVESFDFINWMTELKKKSNEDKEIFHKQEKIRADRIYTDPKTEYGIVHFTRLRETNVPAITQSYVDELQEIGLKKDEYIAEDASCLYDHDINILMIQRNIYSLSPAGIEFYINNFLDNTCEIVELHPVIYKKAFKRGRGKNIYRTITMRTSDVQQNSSLDNPISRAFKELEKLEGYDIEVVVKATKGKSTKLNKKRVETILEEFEEEKEYLSKAEVGFKESEEASLEKIDLLKGKIFTFLPFSIKPKSFLNQDVVQTDMINEYSRKDGSRQLILANR